MCNPAKNEVNIEGDIYIKLIDVHSLYGLPTAKMNEFKYSIHVRTKDSLSDSEKKLNNHFMFLIKNEMYDKPHFKLKKNKKIMNVYTLESEFLKLKPVLEDLDRDKERVTVQFKGIKKAEGFFGEPLYFANEIISVEKASGRTEWDK